MHMGALHPVEQGLVLLLTFGSSVVLSIVVAMRRGSGTDDDQGDPPSASSCRAWGLRTLDARLLT